MSHCRRPYLEVHQVLVQLGVKRRQRVQERVAPDELRHKQRSKRVLQQNAFIQRLAHNPPKELNHGEAVAEVGSCWVGVQKSLLSRCLRKQAVAAREGERVTG